MTGADLLRIIDERIALSRPTAPQVEIARGTVTTVYTSTRTVMVVLDGGDTAVPVTYPMLPDDPVEGDEVVVMRRRDGWLHLLDILGRDPTAAAAAGELPVGTILMLGTDDDPATLLGYGTWEAFGEGRVPFGLKSTDTDFDTLQETGGAKTHTHDYTQVLQHTHTVSITDPGHQHGMDEGTTDGSGTFMDRSNAAAATNAQTNSATTGITASTANPAGSVATGTTASGSTLPPYVVVAMWLRTA